MRGSHDGVQRLNDTLDLVSRIWRSVIQVDDLSHESDFFALGGHSLMAVDVVDACSERLGREIPVGLLFEHPQLSEFVRAILDCESGCVTDS